MLAGPLSVEEGPAGVLILCALGRGLLVMTIKIFSWPCSNHSSWPWKTIVECVSLRPCVMRWKPTSNRSCLGSIAMT